MPTTSASPSTSSPAASGSGTDLGPGTSPGTSTSPGTGTGTDSPTAPEARVLIIMTGGTICMRSSPSGLIPANGFLESALAPMPIFNDHTSPPHIDVVVSDDGAVQKYRSLRTPPTLYGSSIRYAVYEFDELLDSSSIDAKGWAQIARTVYRNYTLFDAFVVLHGTDSLAYSCSALSFMMQNLGKPVVLTGSQAPIFELQTDATNNLLGSLVVAAHFMIPEVGLYFDNKLYRGNRCTKVSASSFAAFDSPNIPPLAVTTAMRTVVAWDLVHRPTQISNFTIQTNLDTTHVACLRIFPGIKPEMVDAVLRLDGLRGLVLETFGAGNAPGGQDDAMVKVLADAIKRGIVIVNVTQCMSGSVSAVYAPGMTLSRAGVVAGLDMTTEAALTKLSYLLALPSSTPDSIARDMSRSLRGELTEASTPIFRHPDQAANKRDEDDAHHLADRDKTFAALAYAVSRGQIERVEDLLRGREWALNEVDYSGNTLLHLAAASTAASTAESTAGSASGSAAGGIEMLRFFLTHGAPVHARNRQGRTPLFVAASMGLEEHVRLLKRSGAHLHADERGIARMAARKAAGQGLVGMRAWEMALGREKGGKRGEKKGEDEEEEEGM